MINKLAQIKSEIDEAIFYLIESDQAWSKEYTRLCKQRKILRRAIKKLEKLEAR